MGFSFSEDYRIPLRVALLYIALLAVPSLLMLDGGDTARLTAIGLAVFWAWVVWCMGRRPWNPTRWDLQLIRWGSLPLVAGLQTAIRFVWHWRGLL